jgi:MFS family permease
MDALGKSPSIAAGRGEPASPGRAWAAVIGSALALAVSNGPIAVFAFGVFIPALIHEFGWSRSQVSLGITLYTLLLGLAGPFFGTLIDRHGQRGPQLVSLICFAGLLACVGLVNSLTQFLCLFALIGIASPGASPLPFSKVVSAWFDRRRGLALGLAMMGTGIGSTILPPVCVALLVAYGWRGGFAGLGAIVAAVAVPSILFLIREPPRVASARRTGAGPMPWRQILADPKFWCVAIPAGLLATAISGTLVHVPTMLSDRGLTAGIIAPIIASSGLASLLGRATTGILLDRFFAPLVATVTFVLAAAGFLAFTAHGPIWLAWCGAILLGFGLGAEVDIVGYLVSRYFPLFSYGRVYGAVFMLFSLGNGAGAYLSGLCFDLTGKYTLAMQAYAAAMVVAVVLVLRMGPYRFVPGAADVVRTP